jgi:acyl-coenzyme A thioesterase PaaI-like protein
VNPIWKWRFRLNYLAPVSGGHLIATGKSIRVGKTICLGEASVEDDKGNLVAHGTSTMMVLDSVKIQGQSEFPPKFLD